VEGIPCGGHEIHPWRPSKGRGSFPYTYMDGLDPQWNKQLTK
jgi:hypothetical protein